VQLNSLQSQLENRYDLHTPHRVEDFLLFDAQLASALTRQGSPGEEQLLLRQDDEGLAVSLYLCEELLARLAADNPHQALHSGNLADFCLAIEGVSHFLHLVWNADHERCVTQLELELLAEIDKFVAATSLFYQQTGSSQSAALQQVLFRTCEFRDDLTSECRQRYYEANRLAARYCRSLAARFALAPDEPGLYCELRRFQRLPTLDKFHHIRAHGCQRLS